MFAPIDRLFVVCSLSRVKKIYIFKCSFKECQMFNKYWPFNSNFRESSNFCISFCSILFFLSVSLSQCISVMHKQMRKIYLLPTHHSRKRVYIIYHTLCLSNFALSLPYTHTPIPCLRKQVQANVHMYVHLYTLSFVYSSGYSFQRYFRLTFFNSCLFYLFKFCLGNT